MYDNEWTDAFEDLHRKVLDERETVDMLAEIVKVMRQQISEIVKSKFRLLFINRRYCQTLHVMFILC